MTGPIFPIVMAVCYNKVTGVAVSLQVGQEIEKEENLGYGAEQKKWKKNARQERRWVEEMKFR